MAYADSTPYRHENPFSLWAEEVAEHPDDPMAHYNYAVACTMAGEPGLAIQSLRKSLTLDPEFAAAHYNLGSLLLEVGEAEEAVAAFRETVRVAPHLPFGHFMLGTALSVAGDPKGAFFATINGLHLAPDDPGGQANAGRSAFALGCFTDAALRYLLAVKLNDADLSLLLCLGRAVCRYTRVAPLELPVRGEEFQFRHGNAEDAATMAMSAWAAESDDVARSYRDRLLDLDRDLSQRVSEVIEGGTEYRARLLALVERAKTDPNFVAVEVTP